MTTSDPPPLSHLLRLLRTAAAFSQEELAERAGLSVRAVSDLERGVHQAPRLETVRMLADAIHLGEGNRAALLAAARPTLAVSPSPVSERAPPRAVLPLTRLTVPKRARRFTRSFLSLLVLVHLLAVAVPVLAQEGSTQEAGVVVGTTGLNIRACPDVSCASLGLAPLADPIIVIGEAEQGFLPVEWRGTVGWAWHLYVSTPAHGTPLLKRGTPGCQRLAIIFNIGIGEPLQLDPLLWLQAEGVPATLFPMGWWAQAFPEDMRTLATLGFPIGSHGDVQLDLTGFTDEEVVATVQDSYAHIRLISGDEPIAYFTPYAANMDERVRNIIARLGYLPVFWDVPAEDWGEGVTAESVYEHVVPNVVDGSIMEFHLDGPSSAESTAIALPRIVADLTARGFQFVTIPEMAQPCAS